MLAELAAKLFHNAGVRAMNGRGDLHGSERRFLASIACAPASVKPWMGLGNAYMGRNEVELALACYRKCHDLVPDSPLPLINIADALLKLGRWEEGWKVYETRYASEGFRQRNGLPGGDAAKMWRGESLEGKTLLLFNEQGAGDTIMAFRFAVEAWIRSRAERVILRVPASLVRLARATIIPEGVAEIISDSDRLPSHDALAPFMSLPRRCKATPPHVIASQGYFKLYDTELPFQFAPTSRDDRLFRVGIVWAGSPGHARDAERSIPLATIAPLFETPGVSWVSLQGGPRASEIKAFPQVRTVPIHDFYDTACVMKSLDLVISVDSSPAHLAGALGVPVWTLLPFAADFRWMLGSETTPWYDAMRLFRQKTRHDWPEVIARVRSRLVSLTQQRAA
jgi:hypothetical protein